MMVLILQTLGMVFMASCSASSVNSGIDLDYSTWSHLGFGTLSFMCDKYDKICNDVLDQIGCTERTVLACGTPHDTTTFLGVCTCYAPYSYDVPGTRIKEDLFDNRIKPEIGWLMEPWQSGPPYDLEISFYAICQLGLERSGCPSNSTDIINHRTMDNVTGLVLQDYTCKCGTFDISSRVQKLITDKMAEADLMALPIFEDPTVLSIELSFALLVICGKLGSILATYLHLPPILGFLLTGIGLADIINPGLLKGAGGNGPHSTPRSEFGIFSLIIVLMRAGLSLNLEDLASRGVLTLFLAVVPYFAEWGVELAMVMKVFGWSVVDAGLLVSIIAALSPSLVIPGMIKLVEEWDLGNAPKQVLSSAPIEVVLAIIMYNVFASIEQNTPSTLYPWVKVLPLWENLVLIPVNICFSCVLGGVVGFCIAQWCHFRSTTQLQWVKRITTGSAAEYLLVFIVMSYLLYALCTTQYIQQSSGVLAVFACGLGVSHFGPKAIVADLKKGLEGVWVFAEIWLFTFTGCVMSFNALNGPAQSNRGINPGQVQNFLQVLFAGQCGRGAGILFSHAGCYFLLPEHRRSPLYFCSLVLCTWIFQIPKATVQATLGGLPLQYHLISGINGLTIATTIQQFAAFSILIMAPLGVMLTLFVGKPLAGMLAQLDRDAGFISDFKAQPCKELEDDTPKKHEGLQMGELLKPGSGGASVGTLAPEEEATLSSPSEKDITERDETTGNELV
ncbi:hypothetical protein B484DRAFT_420795 [Ochromonadaceae sp. CCMP2298]|nr:hypothetical protein B484DRAFT_420795 [Ochromonadaceae sp. CCMP2298]|mmetsp:Transcript_29341/g.65093  ORF Transcript_29341/g.65093 Transcript_29341/m.65093 type:complete len:731 (-) Transcript_29341:87-2279(-)